MLTDDEILDIYSSAVDASMRAASERDGFASNMTRESRVAGLRAIEREAAARALADIRREIRSIPHWWNSEEQRGGFDLQPLGPDATSEEGAFMEVMRVLRARAAEMRQANPE